MQLRIAVLRSELQRQRKALGREIDLRQKDRAQLQKKGKSQWMHIQNSCTPSYNFYCHIHFPQSNGRWVSVYGLDLNAFCSDFANTQYSDGLVFVQ